MNYFLIILLSIAMTISVIEDLRRQKIPNLVTFPTMALALAYYTVSNGLYGLSFSAGGLALGLVLFIIPYSLGGMGAGDVKLMAASGAIFGPKGIIIASIMVILTGGLYGLALFVLNPKYLLSFLKRTWTTLNTFVLTWQFIPTPRCTDEKPLVLRYAVPIALGSLGYMFMLINGYDLFPVIGDSLHMFSINTY